MLLRAAGAGQAVVGGGSGLRDIDFFADLRELRKEFAADHPELEDVSHLNHGAPRDWRLEFERELPEVIRRLPAVSFAQGDAVAIKCTRMAGKLPALAASTPRSRLLHVVRDPRAVTVSYLFGRAPAPGRALGPVRSSATPVTGASGRAARSASTSSPASTFRAGPRLRAHPARVAGRDRGNPPRRQEAFGERAMLVRHEDLRARPVATIGSVYDFLGRPLPPAVARLAAEAVRADQEIVAPDDRRWAEAYDRLGMRDTVRAAGYPA